MTPTPEDPTQPVPSEPQRSRIVHPNPPGRDPFAQPEQQEQPMVLLANLNDFVEQIAQRVVALLQEQQS